MADHLNWPLVRPRARVIIDNDYSGDPDDLIQTVHHLLSPSVDIPFFIASHLSVGDGWDPSEQQAANAEAELRKLLGVMGLAGRHQVYRGAEKAIVSTTTPQDTPAARAIIAEAMRQDTELPLYYAAGAGLTELASALLIEPAIADRLTLVWIGGAEYPELANPPPNADVMEYNLRIDVAAAQAVFRSNLPIWQVPRNVYRQILMSYAELQTAVAPHGRLGRYLTQSIERIMDRLLDRPQTIGETYAMGDSPLVTLTALQSAFQPDASSSSYVWHERLSIGDDGLYGPPSGGGRIRVYTQIDTRLTFSDLFGKLQLWTTSSKP